MIYLLAHVLKLWEWFTNVNQTFIFFINFQISIAKTILFWSQGFVLNIDKQLKNHEITVSRIANFLQNPQAGQSYLNKCIFHVTTESNDYLYKYLVLISPTNLGTPKQFAQNLIDKFRSQLKV